MANKIYKFRDHVIFRTCEDSYNDYHQYKPHLKNDFKSRCAYCNLLDISITTPFEVDHFVPYKKFKNTNPELETNYNNLVYSCKKCNLAKSNKHKGNNKDNVLFYNPVNVDMNEHFYRCNGRINGLDQKANQQIIELKLYRPIHELEWIVGKLYEQKKQLDTKILTESNKEKKHAYNQLRHKILDLHFKYDDILKRSYNVAEKMDSNIARELLKA